MRGRCAAFCASLPSSMRVGPACNVPTKFTPTYGALACAFSSKKISCSVGDAPRPPNSFGQCSPA